MVKLKKNIRRVVSIRSSDPAIASAKWVLEIGPRGIKFHRFGNKAESWYLSWRSVIGYGLVHSAKPRER